MGEAVKAAPRTLGDVFGDQEIPWPKSYNDKSLDSLSAKDFEAIFEMVLDHQAEVERIHDALTDEWAARFEMHPDGSQTRREA